MIWRLSHLVVLSASVLATTVSCAPAHDLPQVAVEDLDAVARLDASERTDFETFFDRSACVCQELLLTGNLVPANVDAVGDSQLHRFASSAGGTAARCSEFPDTRPVVPIALPAHNACAPVASWGQPIAVSNGALNRLADGFCRAEFNRCLASELERRTDSLAPAPRTRAVRDALRAEARERYVASAVELADALGQYADGCGTAGWASSGDTGNVASRRRASECSLRLDATSYASNAINHLADTTLRLGEILELEAQAAAQSSDALSPGEAATPQEYVDDLWGPGGARMAVAEALLGTFDDDVAYGRADPTAATYSSDALDGLYADRVERDERVAIAMRLMVTHEVPFALFVTGGTRTARPALEADPSPFYNLLDHRLAYAARTSPYDLGRVTDEEWEMDVVPLPSAPPEVSRNAPLTWTEFMGYGSRPIELRYSPLRRFYGIEPAHVAAALAMMRNLLDTMDVDYRASTHVTGATTLSAIQLNTHGLRDPHLLGSALQNVGTAAASVYADPLAIVPHGAGSGYVYNYDASVTPDLGAALALHIVRVHLGRIASNPRGRTWLASGTNALREARDLVTSYVGDRWVEYKRHGSFQCPPPRFGICPGHPLCPETSPPGGYLCPEGDEPAAGLLPGRGHIDIYFPPDDARFAADLDGDGVSQGSVVVVRTRGDAYCLVHGHRSDGSDEGCAGATVTHPAEERIDPVARPSRDRLGVDQRRFVLLDPESWAAPSATSSAGANAYVLWRTGPASAPEDEVEYALIDVIQPRRQASVHALGGRFGEMFVDNLAVDPENPGRPAVASLGFSYDFVPPLEHELISDSDGFEDSYQTYIANAADAADQAASQLITARDLEIEALLDARADAALLAEAEVAEDEVISESCGTASGCELVRRPVVRLGDVLVEGAPMVTVPDPSEIPGYDETLPDGQILLDLNYGSTRESITCGAHLARFHRGFDLTGLIKHDWDDYTRSYLSAGLGCMRHLLLSGAHAAVLHEVPEVVLMELEAGGSGQFREASGEVREVLVREFGDILELRNALRAFESTYTAAIAEVDIGARQIDMLTPSGDESFLCHLGQALALIGAAVAAAVTIVATFGAGTAAVVVAVVAIAAAVVAGAAGGVNWVESNCEGDTRPAQAEAQRTFANAVIAMENLHGMTDRVRVAAGAVALADARMDRLQRRVEIARRRREVRRRVAATNAVTDLPEWHVLHGYRVQRARRALFRAQQYAYIARRAVEYRFAVDLATMTRSESFVDPPARWVNDLFVLDTATSADPDTPGSAVNTSGEAIADWVTQLSDFVRGYPFTRRFRDATDAQVVRLENIGLDDRTLPEDVPLYTRMLFKCRDLPGAIPAGEPRPADPSLPWPSAAPCASFGGVEYAELPFSIPAELRGYLAQRLADGNYNYRHEDIAFNIDGSAVVDCSRAVRPWECYGDGNLEYDLRQDGLVFIENHEREIHTFLAEPGVILEGRALTAERVLTNPLSASDAGLIAPFERREMWGRPLMGNYILRIHGRPEINWHRIYGVQMLLRYRYWTRQE